MRKHNDENQNQLKIPSNRQLYALVTKIKLELFGDVNISLAVLSQWLLDHSKIPQNEDEPYVVDYITEINVNYDPIEIYDDEETDAVTFDSTQAQTQIETEPDLPVVYRYFISTKRLLGNAKKSKHTCADATYKLTIIGSPVLINGTTDKKKVFHPFGMAVTSSEKAVDFEFIFNAVKKGVKDIDQIDYKPKALIADAAGAITNGFMQAFGYNDEDEFTRVYCWAHVNINLDKKVKIVKNAAFRQLLIQDICSIQLAESYDMFIKCFNLFVEKWSSKNDSDVNTFIAYFDQQWVQDYYFTNDKNKPITAQYVEIYNRKDWLEFDHYVEWLSFISFIHFKINDWRLSSCSCVHFKKDYICSHLIGLAVRLKIIEVPLEATTVPLGKVRGVGRPSMVASVTCYTSETISSQFQVSSTTVLETSSFEVTDTNKGKKRPLILEEEELEEKEDEVEEEEKERDVEEVPIPIQNKRRGRPPGSKNKKKH